jgi:hypothetical protein
MIFSKRTLGYLKDNEAKLIKSEYRITDINFSKLEAFVNKIDTYQKRNGKLCKLEHKFGRWVPFTKEDIKYGQANHTSFDSSVYGIEEIHGTHTTKYLIKEVKARIIQEYFNGT